MQTGDIRLIKDINDRLVLNLIREHEIISGADLAQITGMRPSTISNILKSLTGRSLIVNMGKGESTEKGGKRPFLWSLKSDAAYAIGIDVEIGEITATVLNLVGQAVSQKVYRVSQTRDVEEVVEQIAGVITDISKQAGLTADNILGVGIAVAGVVESESGQIIISDILDELNVPLRTYLQRSFSFPIAIENNANAAAIGAKWVGSAKGCKNFMTVLIEMDKNVGGIGIGMVLNDELYHGAKYCSGELNVSLPTLSATLHTLRHRFHQGSILKHYQSNPEDLDIYKMIDAAREGDEVARYYFVILGHLIGKNIAKSVGLLNPERLILAGEVSELKDMLINPVQREIEVEVLKFSSECLTIATSIHGRYSVAMGAASIILNDFFTVPIIKKKQIVQI